MYCNLFKFGKQTIEAPVALLFLKNDEQTKQAGFQNVSKALPVSCQKNQNPEKFWPVQNFTSQNQSLAKNSGQNIKTLKNKRNKNTCT